MSITIFGKDRLIKKLRKLGDGNQDIVRRAIAKSALDVESDAKKLVQSGSKTGAIYKKTKGKKTKKSVLHQASAPGEAPATDTGKLVSSITHIIKKQGFEAEIGVFGGIVDENGKKRNYATDLELGTSKIAKRPFLFTSYFMNEEKIKKRIKLAVKRALKEKIR